MIFVSYSIEKNIILCSYSAPLSHTTTCTPTKSNLYFANSLTAAVSEPDLYRIYIPFTKYHVPFPLFRSYQRISPDPKHMYLFCNKASFLGEELLAHLPPSLTGGSLLVGCPRLFIQYVRSYPPFGGCSSTFNVRTYHAVVTGAHHAWITFKYTFIYSIICLMRGHEASCDLVLPLSVSIILLFP
jgi:hypothetical protein